ncbi:transcriptional regulator [Legionella norrlandica]|uniref:Transcriptional regulator n=1 Tax=Legionella norrlandica TaxID=1498499 RepID=A0A0A2SUM0_9GAMM|nr:AraC family transcriptional regulator [Legionella norrlandica]KGP63391.1 transcriptional regulator [Legionella norrlandica]
MDQIIAANYLSTLEKCLEQFGINHFLEKIGIDPARVHDPNAYLSSNEFNNIVMEAYRLSQCPQLGLVFGQSLSIVNHGFLGYAAMSSPTFGAAIHTVLSYLNTRTSLLSLELSQLNKENNAYVKLLPHTQDVFLSRFITELTITHLIKMRNFLVNCISPPLKIELNYAEPPYVEYYNAVFQSEIIFNADNTRIWFKAEELDYPINFADDVSYQLAKTQLQEIEKNLSLKEDLASKIKSILINQNLNHASMEEIAGELCMTSRTLRRHLQRLEVTYQELLDEVREQKAKTFLLNNNISMTEISFLLGFHDTSNFSKAFKRWTGITPTEYREKHGIR